jgi:hypothetical protein
MKRTSTPPMASDIKAPTKSARRMAELEETIETMHASRIYQECNPDKSLVEMQVKLTRALETIATLDQTLSDLSAKCEVMADEKANLLAFIASRERELEEEKAQAIATVDELLSERQTVMSENCDLLASNRELEERVDELSTSNGELQERVNELSTSNSKLQERVNDLLKKIEAASQADVEQFQDETVKNQRDIANQQLGTKQIQQTWRQALLSNKKIEPGAKIFAQGIEDLMADGKQDKHGATPLMSLDHFGRRIGLGENAVSTHVKRYQQAGIIEVFYGEETRKVKNGRGEKEVTVYPISIKKTDLWNQPERWDKGSVKKHGGFSPKPCGNCSRVDWQSVPHKRCRYCGQEEVKRPLTEEQEMQNEAAIAIGNYDQIVKSEWTVVVAGIPIVESDTPKIEAASQADVEQFQDETVKNRQEKTKESLQHEIGNILEAIDTRQHATPKIETASQADLQQFQVETVRNEASEETHEEQMLRFTCETWKEIERKDPGCWVPENVVDYWRAHGRDYHATKKQEVVARPQTPMPLPEMHTVVNFKTQSVDLIPVN